VDYQTRVASGISQSDADLVMTYIEQLTDPVTSSPHRPTSSVISAIQRGGQALQSVGTVKTCHDDQSAVREGKPNSNIIVVSDHGFAPFHRQLYEVLLQSELSPLVR